MGNSKNEPKFLWFKKRCTRKYVAELFGTMILVLAAVMTHTWLDPLSVSFLTYALIVVGLACVIQPLSGCHLNPAVSIGEAYDGEVYFKCGFTYIAFQFVGAVLAGILMFFITGTDTHSAVHAPAPIDYSSFSSIIHVPVINFIVIFIFVFIVTGAVSREGKGKLIGVIVGLSLVLEHAVGLLIHGASINPMINIGVSVQMALHGIVDLIQGGGHAASFFEPLRDLWVYIIPAALAAVCAGLIIRPLYKSDHHAHSAEEKVLHECHAWHGDHHDEHKEHAECDGTCSEDCNCSH